MSITLELLDRLKVSEGIESDNQAALRLGLSRSAVSLWRAQDREGSPAAVEKIAKALGEDGSGYILMIAAKQQRDAESRRTLEKLAKKFAPFAALLFIAAIPHIANAKSVQGHNVDKCNFTYSDQINHSR